MSEFEAPQLPDEIWQNLPSAVQQYIELLQTHFQHQITALQAQVDQLQTRLDQNSQNSSKPPSTDPPYQRTPKRLNPKLVIQKGDKSATFAIVAHSSRLSNSTTSRNGGPASVKTVLAPCGLATSAVNLCAIRSGKSHECGPPLPNISFSVVSVAAAVHSLPIPTRPVCPSVILGQT